MTEKKADLLLIDGKNMAMRCAGALGLLMPEDEARKKRDDEQMQDYHRGRKSGVVASFLRTFCAVRRDEGGLPIVAWEGSKNWRREVHAAYKAQRPPTPTWLEVQLDAIVEYLSAAGVRQVVPSDGEGDDAIATLADRFAQKGRLVVVYSGDADFLQLVTPGSIHVVVPKGGPYPLRYDTEEAVEAELGCLPSQVTSYKAIVGDKADNLTGVPGLGPKAAGQILSLYDDLPHALDAARHDHYEGTPGHGRKLKDHADLADLMLRLVTLNLDVGLEHIKVMRDAKLGAEVAKRIGAAEFARPKVVREVGAAA